MNYVHLVSFAQGHIEMRLAEGAPANLPGQITDRLNQWTGQRWVVSLSRAEGAPTLASVQKKSAADLQADVSASPVVAEILNAFPGAKIIDIKTRETV
jgi:DNA polymerase-3 subunit gamma/tau